MNPSEVRAKTIILPGIMTTILLLSLCVQPAAEYRGDIGVRPLGMGGAFASLADDPTGVFWNPSGIADIRHREFVYDLSQGCFSSATSIGRAGALGLSLVDMNYTDRFLVDSSANPFGMFLTGDNQILLSYAKRFRSGVAFGVNFGYNRAADPDSLWSTSVDIGVDVRLSRWLSTGFGARDIRDTRIYSNDGDLLRSYERQFLFGINLNPSRYFRLNAALNPDKARFSSGAELRVKWLSLRAGIIEDITWQLQKPKWTTGITVNLRGRALNYAYVSDPDMVYQHLVSLQFKFPPPTPKGGLDILDQLRDHDDIQVNADPPKLTKPRQTDVVRNPRVSASPKLDKVHERLEPIEPKIDLSELPVVDPLIVEHEPDDQKTESVSHIGENEQQLKVRNEFERVTGSHNVDPVLVLSIIRVESNFDPNAVSSVGAVGLMQLMPGTAREMGLKVPMYKNRKRPNSNPTVDERFHPRKNLEAGLKYFRGMLDKYSDNYVLAVCAYNSGPARVKKDIPGIRQTERFAAKVMNHYYDYRANGDLRTLAMAEVSKLIEN
jgi:hypothetical protein